MTTDDHIHPLPQSKVPKQDWVLIDSMRRRCVRKADSYTSIAAFLQDWDKMVCNTKKVRMMEISYLLFYFILYKYCS